MTLSPVVKMEGLITAELNIDFLPTGQNRRLKMRLPVLRSMRQPSLSKDQFEGVVVDYLQVRLH